MKRSTWQVAGLVLVAWVLSAGCKGGGAVGAECTEDAGCASGLSCVVGQCRSACPCGPNEVCVESEGACFAKNCGGTTCFGTEVCIDGQKCGEAACGGKQCGTLACDAATGSCVTCTAAKGCGTGQKCEAGACVCASSEGAEKTCNDGQDNDCDGKVDCADEDCLKQTCAPGGATCEPDPGATGGTSANTCFCPGKEKPEFSCGDGQDNDCDGKVDCADEDCAGFVCRSAKGVCDVAESCQPGQTTCPADAFLPSTQICNAAIGDCDAAERCTGTSADCPADLAKPNTEVCRPATGDCDAPEYCDGATKYCPSVDKVRAAGTICSSGGGTLAACDKPEKCDGAAKTCPADTGTSFCSTSKADACDPSYGCSCGGGPACGALFTCVAGACESNSTCLQGICP